jgi:hypothetical protein
LKNQEIFCFQPAGNDRLLPDLLPIRFFDAADGSLDRRIEVGGGHFPAFLTSIVIPARL